MKHLRTYLACLLFCLIALVQGQKSAQVFLNEFKKASPEKKIQLVASKDFSEIEAVYPLIKDSLEQLKKITFAGPKPGHLKFLFDKFEAGAESYRGNYAKAILILENSLRHHTSGIDDSLRCLVALKILFVKIKNYSKALETNALLELKWPRKTDSAAIYYGIAKSSIYHQLALTEKAINERRHEYNANKNKNDTIVTVSYLNDMGVFFNSIKSSDSAKAYLGRAKSLLSQLCYPANRENSVNFFKALVDGNLALAFYNAGMINEAIPLLTNDIYYSIKVNNYKGAFNSYLLFAKLELDLAHPALAGSYLDTARSLLTQKIAEDNFKLKLFLAQADHYDRTGNFMKANENYRQYLELKNKVTNIEDFQRMQNENTSLTLEQKEIEQVEHDNMLKQVQLEEAKQTSYKAYLFAGILILLSIMAFLIQNNYSAKKREIQLFNKNMQISSQKLLIEQSLKEKETLIKEIHHRVKNNLQIINSMLSLQMAKVEDGKTAEILSDARQRISSIALTHQMLYQKESLSNIRLGEYLQNLVRQIELTIQAGHVDLVTDIRSTESKLTIDTAIPFGLLVNELLTNAYKHAFPQGIKGRITVTLSEDEQSFTLKISDNGIGLPENFSAVERKTLGMELIYILTEQLDAQLEIGNTNGSTFILKIKKPQ